MSAGRMFPTDYFKRKLEIQRDVDINKESEIPQLSREEPETMLHGTWSERVARKTTRNDVNKIKILNRWMMKYQTQVRGNKTWFRVSRENYNGLRIMKRKLGCVKVEIPNMEK